MVHRYDFDQNPLLVSDKLLHTSDTGPVSSNQLGSQFLGMRSGLFNTSVLVELRWADASWRQNMWIWWVNNSCELMSGPKSFQPLASNQTLDCFQRFSCHFTHEMRQVPTSTCFCSVSKPEKWRGGCLSVSNFGQNTRSSSLLCYAGDRVTVWNMKTNDVTDGECPNDNKINQKFNEFKAFQR